MHIVYNCIIVFNPAKDAVLFCRRQKEPYKDLLNFDVEDLGENVPGAEA